MTYFDHDFGPHINWKLWKNGLFFNPVFKISVNIQTFWHISRDIRGVFWLKFGHLAVFDLPELMTGSDLDCGLHINRKNWKNELFSIIL